MFWLGILLMGMLAGLFVLAPFYLIRTETESAAERDRLNLALYQDRISELEAHAEDGRNDTGLETLELDAKKSLLQDLHASELRTYTLGSTRAALIAAVLLPLSALFVYHE